MYPKRTKKRREKKCPTIQHTRRFCMELLKAGRLLVVGEFDPSFNFVVTANSWSKWPLLGK